MNRTLMWDAYAAGKWDVWRALLVAEHAEVLIRRIMEAKALCALKGCFIDAGFLNSLSTQITAGVYNMWFVACSINVHQSKSVTCLECVQIDWVSIVKTKLK